MIGHVYAKLSECGHRSRVKYTSYVNMILMTIT